MEPNNIQQTIKAHSSVIVLYDLSKDSLILTKRSLMLKKHPGEVCFPGGFQETKDQNLYSTALRELNEELGITSDRITLIRKLKIEKTLLGLVIHPWYASIDSIFPYTMNPQEVSELILVPMPLVKNQANYKEVRIEKEGRYFSTCQFIADKELIWGATARIMRQLAS
ncbi:CoA pyrophosphatase [Legionella sp. PATHC032]|uniref:NUDIX hydrolase n=1 Tax=Legionella sp. PATHC032 TaxID=2992039 RepID=UPI001B05B017|nr:CoA pyrophosphatase [Legionella sp. PATHC032]MCW8421439.1 CoA pyrophosphatase [Legionella sp. PATHC032]HAZ7572624.1 CoA pyrophosphatase [Legionella pneumophila]HBA1633978.1 CoA pyrophosphatase [Legionella pneumophila]